MRAEMAEAEQRLCARFGAELKRCERQLVGLRAFCEQEVEQTQSHVAQVLATPLSVSGGSGSGNGNGSGSGSGSV